VIVQVGGAIGIWPTLALLIVDGFVGAALARSQGRAAWERFNRALTDGRIPARETFDGAMIILGGALLLTPGFITDLVGFALLIPPTRDVVRAVLTRFAGRRIRIAWWATGPVRGAARRRAGRERAYDYEGSAREVTDPPTELPPAQRDG
jgi:UPF0716 protein FxsA